MTERLRQELGAELSARLDAASHGEAMLFAAGVATAIRTDLETHLRWFGESGPRGRLFVGPRGGHLRRSNFHHIWTAAVKKAGLSPLHFHDLRHTRNAMAADTGPARGN